MNAETLASSLASAYLAELARAEALKAQTVSAIAGFLPLGSNDAARGQKLNPKALKLILSLPRSLEARDIFKRARKAHLPGRSDLSDLVAAEIIEQRFGLPAGALVYWV